MAVDVCACPRPVPQLWRGGLDGLEGPILLSCLNIDIAPDSSDASAGARIWRAHLHPVLKGRDLCRGKLLLGRHLQVFIGPAYRFDEQALLEIAWHHCRAALTAPARAGLGVQQKLAFHLFGLGRVALVAILHQHRSDFLFKEINLSAGQRLFLCQGTTGNQCKNHQKCLKN